MKPGYYFFGAFQDAITTPNVWRFGTVTRRNALHSTPSFSAPQLRLVWEVSGYSPPRHAYGSLASSGQHVGFCFSVFQSFEMTSYHRCLCFSVRPPTLLTRAENAMDLNSLPYNIEI